MSKKINLPEPIGFIFAFVLELYLLFGSELTTLKCKRFQLNQKVTCEVTYFGLLGKRITEIIPGQLQGAKKKRMGHKRKSGYGVFLLTEYDEIPIQEAFSASSELVATQKVDQVNNFINNPEQISLEILQNPNWFIVFWGIIFVISPMLSLVLMLLGSGERKSSIRRIQRELSYPYHEDEKSDIS
ncbi:MAG: hypothetical protein F6K18_20420 [Okeania sp. SIO2C2]|uniref:hypothetical protein n=1 Tax=Okeania sp. SIO2C2 TaxID=2607787 RepID=UPI0013BE869E|nr:hypothetical protein [Okeania sp. SIO2C2]NEP89004.1 hypothetical protein [Okeania sp. SIO2C2]